MGTTRPGGETSAELNIHSWEGMQTNVLTVTAASQQQQEAGGNATCFTAAQKYLRSSDSWGPSGSSHVERAYKPNGENSELGTK